MHHEDMGYRQFQVVVHAFYARRIDGNLAVVRTRQGL
jgi:hypothetical protein